MTIGLMMVVRNEKEKINKCLDWHLPYFDEVSICDQKSEDGTWEILQEYKKKSKIPFSLWQDEPAGFPETSKQKTVSLLKTDWVLLVDADEFFSKEFLEKMHEIVKDKKFIGYTFPRNNIFHVKVYDDSVPIKPKWLKVLHPSRDYQLRLSIRKFSVFPPFLHHRVRINGETNGDKIGISTYAINHIKTIQDQWEDQRRYKGVIKNV
jgi:glycosyltransferase involved in cell wall biosynthesis